ncbi:LysR family transcriptional regulator [Pulveribacter sp.]|uniref:LysR family transcriptional regulator n=2 Tax=Pulveribacter sp. TaxID=2678893 RepID=UPI0028AC23B8|nr:LysR family transcriptional regulator [Pulveribacter sp.]
MVRPLQAREIEAFQAVIQTGTTTAAAQLMHTTQPSISRLLAQMQAAAGVKLFEMHKGRLRPTREAMELYATVQQHFVGRERIERELAVLRQSGAGSLRIGCTPALALSVVPPVMGRYLQRYPGAHLSIQTLGANELRDGVLHGKFDLVLSTMVLASEALDATVLHRGQGVCVMHPDHPLAGRAQLHVQDLQDQLLLTLNASDSIFMQLQQKMLAFGVTPSATIETNYSSTICRLAAQGLGVGVVNPYMAAVFDQDLKILALQPECSVEVVLALPPQYAPSARVDMLTALLREQFLTYG